MRAIIQRVKQARVLINDTVNFEIGLGFLVTLGVTASDTPMIAEHLAAQVGTIPAYQNKSGQIVHGVEYARGEILAVADPGVLERVYRNGNTVAMAGAPAELADSCCRAFLRHFEEQKLRTGFVPTGQSVQLDSISDGNYIAVIDWEGV